MGAKTSGTTSGGGRGADGALDLAYRASILTVNEIARTMAEEVAEQQVEGRGTGRDVTSVVLVESAGLIACACSDGKVYLREIRVGSASLAVLAHKLEQRSPSAGAALDAVSRAPAKMPALNDAFVFKGHHLAVKALVWCRSSKSFASAGLDRQVRYTGNGFWGRRDTVEGHATEAHGGGGGGVL
jgi:hypothetical protein